MADLTELADVKAFMGLTDTSQDAQITAAIPASTLMIKKYLGYDILTNTYTNEVYDGNGSNVLPLRSFPITAISTLYLTDISVTSPIASTTVLSTVSGYWNDDKFIYLRGYTFCMGKQNVVVSYTAGYAEPPADVNMAANMIVQALVSAGSIDPNIVNENVPNAYTANFKADAGRLPDNAMALLNQYRRWW